jgi:site-specific recombinase XerD
MIKNLQSNQNADNFVTSFGNAKFDPDAKLRLIKQIATTCRKEHFNYEDLRYIYRRVREELKLKPKKQAKRLPTIMTSDELADFFRVIEASNVIHALIFRLMYITGIRVSELCGIKLSDINSAECKISIRQGKGSKDRTVLFPELFKLTLNTYLASIQKQTYLFENSQYKQFTTRRIQQLFKEYKTKAGIQKPITPHTLRHQCLTYLTSKGLTDSQIQLISGHSDKETLSIYQHLSLEQVEASYQQAFK